MIGSSKDNPPKEIERPAAGQVPEKKPGTPRAKKPKADDKNRSAVKAEKTPDPLMMIPEDDGTGSGTGNVETEPSSLLAKKTPARSALITIPPSGNKTPGILAKVNQKKTILAAGIVILIIGILLVFSGVLHGVSSPSPGSPSSSMNTTVNGVIAPETPDAAISTATVSEPAVIAVTTTETVSLVPGPTQVPPDTFMVNFQAERDPRSKIVSVQFMGGKGQYGVRDVFVRLTRSDGEVLTATFRPIQSGSGVELQGTEKVDRIEVIVNYHTGDVYKVIDKNFEYKIRS